MPYKHNERGLPYRGVAKLFFKRVDVALKNCIIFEQVTLAVAGALPHNSLAQHRELVQHVQSEARLTDARVASDQ